MKSSSSGYFMAGKTGSDARSRPRLFGKAAPHVLGGLGCCPPGFRRLCPVTGCGSRFAEYCGQFALGPAEQFCDGGYVVVHLCLLGRRPPHAAFVEAENGREQTGRKTPGKGRNEEEERRGHLGTCHAWRLRDQDISEGQKGAASPKARPPDGPPPHALLPARVW